ncbi:Thioredoxin-related protein [Cyclobacterium xiamenense]|uniref:Thioredoxin-related protein n=1 Tax=Cyclobacterium xiamenense TaxID=1297121 RepID=A0A1H6ULY0_9BACT|nr:thioredoxin fold domain-containing protein [Cyclobacterium xiamenense]SEI90717.1 Thioredoxin-related protein [Cyclobacterium xiamenense]
MKKMVGILVIGLLVSTQLKAQAQEITWYSFEEVIDKVETTPKMILIDVYTDWCGWCKKMDKETFTDKEVIAYVNENFYAVKLNAEDSKKKFEFRGREYSEEDMARAMRVQSYPNFVIMDAAMENITQLPGYREAKPFVSSLVALLENFKQ